jgi:hypothetical protein
VGVPPTVQPLFPNARATVDALASATLLEAAQLLRKESVLFDAIAAGLDELLATLRSDVDAAVAKALGTTETSATGRRLAATELLRDLSAFPLDAQYVAWLRLNYLTLFVMSDNGALLHSPPGSLDKYTVVATALLRPGVYVSVYGAVESLLENDEPNNILLATTTARGDILGVYPTTLKGQPTGITVSLSSSPLVFVSYLSDVIGAAGKSVSFSDGVASAGVVEGPAGLRLSFVVNFPSSAFSVTDGSAKRVSPYQTYKMYLNAVSGGVSVTRVRGKCYMFVAENIAGAARNPASPPKQVLTGGTTTAPSAAKDVAGVKDVGSDASASVKPAAASTTGNSRRRVERVSASRFGGSHGMSNADAASLAAFPMDLACENVRFDLTVLLPTKVSGGEVTEFIARSGATLTVPDDALGA